MNREKPTFHDWLRSVYTAVMLVVVLVGVVGSAVGLHMRAMARIEAVEVMASRAMAEITDMQRNIVTRREHEQMLRMVDEIRADVKILLRKP